MSYPKQIQPLVIEDDNSPKVFYDALFASLSEAVAPPRYAFCLQDAETALNESMIFHLVILDLRLPEQPRQPPSTQLDHGLTLLNRCLNRNRYPIPALLVISGQLGRAANQTELEDHVRRGFAYGRVVVKGDNAKDIKQAIQEAQNYCAVGVHLRDSDSKTYPVLSPRDDDLLRRSILEQASCGGVDLKWWSAQFSRPTGPYAEFKGWNKILMGRYLMSDGRGPSLPRFFKFLPSGGSTLTQQEAKVMEHKLRHIKVLSCLSSGDRSLLVTENISGGDSDPIPLDQLLIGPELTQELLASIVEEVSMQVRALSDHSPNQVPLKDLLWKDHNPTELESYLSASGYKGEGTSEEPITVLADLLKNEGIVRVTRSLCHGDLNISNVALEISTGGTHAYVIDASGMQLKVNVWDLAMLEVTALLHQIPQSNESLVKIYAAHFGRSLDPVASSVEGLEPHARNTLRLITAVRKQALSLADPKIYGLMLFDHALIQLGGLSFGSNNKITRPGDAVQLVFYLATLLRTIAQDWFERVEIEGAP